MNTTTSSRIDRYNEDVAPLVQIERAVLDRAKERGLDIDAPSGRADLEQLIRTELDLWRIQFERGERSLAVGDPEAAFVRALRNLAGYGPLEPLLDDDDVYEIMVNAPSAIFVKRHSGVSGYHDEVFHDDEHVIRTLTKIINDSSAAGSNRKLDPSEGLQDAQLDSGARMHIVHQDVGRDSHLIVNIRKFTGVNIRSLNELALRGSLEPSTAAFLRAAVRSGATVVMAGAPGSGKTTLLSCCAAELDPSLRVVVAEEVFEADVPLANVASMQTRPGRADRKEVDLRRLVAGFLRMAPDVAIVGEVRDREVLPLLLTLSSGIQGFTTIHAGSARQALTRLRFIAQLADTSNEIPMSALNALISEAIDLVVHCERTPEGLRISEILALEELSAGSDSVTFTTTDLFRRIDSTGPLFSTGQIPVRLTRMMERRGFDVRRLLEAGSPQSRETQQQTATRGHE
jgi:pilus assembly protein CpaF